jgi:transposase
MGKKDNSVSAEKLSIIKFKKLIINVTNTKASIQTSTIPAGYSLTIKTIPKGTMAKSGKKLKNDKADLPKT